MRLDLYLFQNAYAKSRQRAKCLIEDGNVTVDGTIITKPSYDIDDALEHSIKIENDCPYVSRGGLKLEKILSVIGINVNDKVCLDIGASTGGFTHCLLLNGAKKVYAVDSGSDQLDPTLRENERVVSIENYNARNISSEIIDDEIDIITIDVSFISQNLILPNASKLLNENGIYLSLIKPQFEVGKSNVGKGGIVKDKKARLMAVNSVVECAKQHSLICNTFIKSPIQGGDGNIEYLACFSQHGVPVSEAYIKKIVFE